MASSAHQLARAATISGRSCSCARRVFFAWQSQLPQCPAHGRAAHLHPGPLGQLGCVLGQGQIVALCYQVLELVQRYRIQLWGWATGMRLGSAASLGPPLLLPAIERGLTHLEQRRNLGPAQLAALADP